MLDNAIHRLNPAVREIGIANGTVHWIDIHPVDSAMDSLNSWAWLISLSILEKTPLQLDNELILGGPSNLPS